MRSVFPACPGFWHLLCSQGSSVPIVSSQTLSADSAPGIGARAVQNLMRVILLTIVSGGCISICIWYGRKLRHREAK